MGKTLCNSTLTRDTARRPDMRLLNVCELYPNYIIIFTPLTHVQYVVKVGCRNDKEKVVWCLIYNIYVILTIHITSNIFKKFIRSSSLHVHMYVLKTTELNNIATQTDQPNFLLYGFGPMCIN